MAQKNFDFDTILDRRNTSCGKWDARDQRYGGTDFIHLGVADMDFKSPPPIIEKLHQRVEHGVLDIRTWMMDIIMVLSPGWKNVIM